MLKVAMAPGVAGKELGASMAPQHTPDLNSRGEMLLKKELTGVSAKPAGW